MSGNKLVESMRMLDRAPYHDKPNVLAQLGEICGEECLSIYCTCLQESNPKLKIAALNVLASLLGEDAKQYLQGALQDKDRGVKRTAKKLMSRLDKKGM